MREALQLLGVTHFIVVWLILPIVSIWLPFYILLCTQFWWLICIYIGWYCYDFTTPRRGSRNWQAYRSWSLWTHFADYFPIKLVKTVDILPDRNYILGCHPHGVLSVGAFTHLCTAATGFAEKFPGLQPNIATLNGQFYFPFRREIGIALGGVQCCKRSINHLLECCGVGRLVGIVIGGAEEALDARPGRHIVNIRHRRGFCRLALQHGAHLIPSFSFGENDIFRQEHNERGTPLRRIQTLIKNRLGFCPPLFTGRGLVFEWFGIFPFRRPITTVVGAPIAVPRFDHPSRLQVEALHARYCIALIELFEAHKTAYGVPPYVHLELV